MTILELVEICRQHWSNVEVTYLHPTLYIFCVSDEFEKFDEDARLALFVDKASVDEDALDTLMSAAGVRLCLLTNAERKGSYAYVKSDEAPRHWLPLLDRHVRDSLPQAKSEPIPAVHFYGYKGGQARSTTLVLLAQALAIDGYRVLIVDADLEAPSIDFMMGAPALGVESTLMGLCGWAEAIIPIPVIQNPLSSGSVDVIPCRPQAAEYDMDFAAFTVRMMMDTSVLSDALQRLKEFVKGNGEQRYDVVLFDHRTGIAASVLPIVHEWRGPVVVALRPDGLSQQAIGAFASLFAQNPENPGAYVCFSLDPEDSREDIFDRHATQVQSLLEELSTAIARGVVQGGEDGDDDEDVQMPTDALQSFWVSWYADRAFLSKLAPKVDELSKDNQDSLQQLRDVLELSGRRAALPNTVSEPIQRSPSGARDKGWFIETPDVARLFSRLSPLTYIVGRKGTGKTRLYFELVNRELAEPMFAAADYSGGGLKSQSVAYRRLLDICSGDFAAFWWSLLAICIACGDSRDSVAFDGELSRFCELDDDARRAMSAPHAVVVAAAAATQKRVFLIDGIETAVTASMLGNLIESMMMFLLTIQSDASLSSNISIRLFIRTDLLRTASQNVEQQTNGRKLDLRWDRDSIFNFVLARLVTLDWFARNFPETCEKIKKQMPVIRAGQLPRQDYEALLLEIFPARLRRFNIQTLTFFESYFSDAGGDSDKKASFYPRLFEAFLVRLVEIAEKSERESKAVIEDERVSGSIVLAAHAAASQEFVEEVKQELYVLLNLGDDSARNRELVDRFVAAFDGLPTPFSLEEMIVRLESSLAGVDSARIRHALQRMKDVGIFEDRPSQPGDWRAGRLYKSALRMKYVRAGASR